jgi:post-segregation antitoxin (ccd killing protein)
MIVSPLRNRNHDARVYSMRMARINVYLPDALASDAREADLNVSALAQEAVRRALDARRTDAWIDDVLEMKGSEIDVAVVLAAVRDARYDLEHGRE